MFLLSCTPIGLWWFCGEAFLSHTDRCPAEALIVEGWIGIEGVQAARNEFFRDGYRFVVTTGAMTSDRWGPPRWNYAVEARRMLIDMGVPEQAIIVAPAPETESQRTFFAALGVKRALAKRNVHFENANVFTLGVHARRSRLVFAKALPDTRVGVISWVPARYSGGRWWNSSERASDLVKESAGWLFERALNSGRISNSDTLPAQ